MVDCPCSIGQFVDVQKNGWVDLLLGDFNSPHKVNNKIAIGSTSREYVRPAGNLCVLRGEGWASVLHAGRNQPRRRLCSRRGPL